MSNDTTLRPVRAAIILFFATTLWGGSFLAMKALGLEQEKIGPTAGTWFFASLSLLARFGVSALLLALWLGRRLGTATRSELWQGLGLGCFGGLGILLQVDGVQYTAASTSAFLTQCYCVFIPVTLAWHRRKWPGRTLALCCALVFAGMFVLSNIHLSNLRMGRGEWETVLASLVFTGQILWLERPVFQGNRSLIVSCVMFSSIAFLALPVLMMTGVPPRKWLWFYHTGPALWLIGFLAIGANPGRLRHHERLAAAPARDASRPDLLLRTLVHQHLRPLPARPHVRRLPHPLRKRRIDNAPANRRRPDHRRQPAGHLAYQVAGIPVEI